VNRLAGLLALACFAGLGAIAIAAPPPAKPAKPAAKPTKPAAKPTKPAAKPTKPAAKPKPAAKTAKSTKPAGKPTKPAAKPKDTRFVAPADATTSPAYRYGQLSQVDCEAELTKRTIGFVREAARGVLAPVRLTGPLQGVTFRTDLGDQARATTPWEIGDCRLVLALDDLAGILKQHGIVEVRHYSMYRPPPKAWPDGKIGTRHDGALALDAGRFVAKDGTVLDVDKHFHGAIGARTCGDGAAPYPATAEALALRSILCEAVDRRLFNVVLTPNYNPPHKNHFHLEVTEGVKWFLVH